MFSTEPKYKRIIINLGLLHLFCIDINCMLFFKVIISKDSVIFLYFFDLLKIKFIINLLLQNQQFN